MNCVRNHIPNYISELNGALLYIILLDTNLNLNHSDVSFTINFPRKVCLAYSWNVWMIQIGLDDKWKFQCGEGKKI